MPQKLGAILGTLLCRCADILSGRLLLSGALLKSKVAYCVDSDAFAGPREDMQVRALPAQAVPVGQLLAPPAAAACVAARGLLHP